MKKRAGFTLIEGLVALTILAVLAVGAYTVWQRPAVDESSPTPTAIPSATITETPKLTPAPTQAVEITTTPTPDPTAGWETYTNPQYSYTLAYASNSELKTVTCGKHGLKPSLGSERFILYNRASSQSPEEDYECLTNGENHIITVSPYSEEWPCNNSTSWQASRSETEIAGRKGVRCEIEFVGERVLPGPDKVIRVSVSNGSQFFVLGLEDTDYLDTFNQILSTFQFTD